MAFSDPFLNDFIPAVIFLVEYEWRPEDGTSCFRWGNLVLLFYLFFYSILFGIFVYTCSMSSFKLHRL